MHTDEDRARFGAWLRKRRAAINLTQVQFTERHGIVNRSTLSKIESGSMGIAPETAIALGEATGADGLDALIAGGFVRLEGLSLESLEWARDVYGLPDDIRQMMIAMLREAKRIAEKRSHVNGATTTAE